MEKWFKLGFVIVRFSGVYFLTQTSKEYEAKQPKVTSVSLGLIFSGYTFTGPIQESSLGGGEGFAALPALDRDKDIDKMTFKVKIKTGLYLYARTQSHDPPDLEKLTDRGLNTSYS